MIAITYAIQWSGGPIKMDSVIEQEAPTEGEKRLSPYLKLAVDVALQEVAAYHQEAKAAKTTIHAPELAKRARAAMRRAMDQWESSGE